MGVEHLKSARETKNDEFYTQYCDIERERFSIGKMTLSVRLCGVRVMTIKRQTL